MERQEFRLGIFSVGDLISLCSALVIAGVMWQQVQDVRAEARSLREDRDQQMRESFEYVRRAEYRDDVRELKQLLQQVNEKLDRKVDKP